MLTYAPLRSHRPSHQVKQAISHTPNYARPPAAPALVSRLAAGIIENAMTPVSVLRRQVIAEECVMCTGCRTYRNNGRCVNCWRLLCNACHDSHRCNGGAQ